MPEGGYKIRNQQGLHFITFAVVEWVDVFTRKEYRDVLIESLAYCINKKGLRLHAWVIMSNHVHFIISAKDENKLSDILRDFKKYPPIPQVYNLWGKITAACSRVYITAHRRQEQ